MMQFENNNILCSFNNHEKTIKNQNHSKLFNLIVDHFFHLKQFLSMK